MTNRRQRRLTALLTAGLLLLPGFPAAAAAPTLSMLNDAEVDKAPATSEADQTALCEEITAKADARREAILSSPTDVSVSGTSYYVSAQGDDRNDGLSPETSWRTVKKVNETELSEGDGVFFHRGDLWRGI